MKIKLSFITNSSSTIYIIFVPDDFSPNTEYISNICRGFLEKVTSWKIDNFNIDKFIEEIQNQFELFKEGKQYSYYDCSHEEFLEWNTITKICEDNNLIMTEVDLSGPGNDVIQGIAQETILKTLTNYINLDEFMKPFIREEKDDTEITKKVK